MSSRIGQGAERAQLFAVMRGGVRGERAGRSRRTYVPQRVEASAYVVGCPKRIEWAAGQRNVEVGRKIHDSKHFRKLRRTQPEWYPAVGEANRAPQRARGASTHP